MRLRAVLDEVPQAQYAFTAHSLDDLRGVRPPADIYLVDADPVGGADEEAWLSELLPRQAGVVWLFPAGAAAPRLPGEGAGPRGSAGAGPGAFLSLEADATDIAAALAAVAAGLQVWDPRLDREAAGDQTRSAGVLAPAAEPDVHLTSRESEVLDLLAAGYGNEAIAGALGVSVNTVKFHLKSLYEKLSVSNRTQALREAARHGLLVL
jgi:DNA-binding CsgD family transcriptional regulator